MNLLSFLPDSIRGFIVNLPLPESWINTLRAEPKPANELFEEKKSGNWRMTLAIIICIVSAYITYKILD